MVCLSKFFGKQSPRTYKHNVLLRGAKLTLTEAQIVVGHLKRAVDMETMVIRSVYPLVGWCKSIRVEIPVDSA